MTRDDRSAPRDREQTQPDGLAARTRDAAPADTGPVDSSPAPQDSGRKSFNPWRFGFHTVSADHRRELLEMELPETPPERLFDEQSLAGTPETSDAAPTTPLVHPLRLAAVWAGLAAVAVVVVLWLLFGGVKSASEAKATTAMPSTSTAATARAAALAPTQPRAAPPSVTVAAPPDDGPASKAASAASPSKKPEASPHAASAVSRPAQRATTQPNTNSDTKPSAAPKPISPTSDDDASPFGHWTAPPRDN